jgi:hypothetical protein
MQNSSKIVVLKIIEGLQPKSILDVPSGDGWLVKNLNPSISIDGIDLFQSKNKLYRKWESFKIAMSLLVSLRATVASIFSPLNNLTLMDFAP